MQKVLIGFIPDALYGEFARRYQLHNLPNGSDKALEKLTKERAQILEISKASTSSAGFEQEDGDLSEVEVDEVLGLVGNV